jgi:hypothetical protein
MNTKTRPPRPRLALDEVLAQVQAKLPALIPHLYRDGEWLWYCGPSLAGADNKPVRETLKEIGFRFAFSGHRMRNAAGEQTDIIGTWGHSCKHPTPPRRRDSRASNDTEHTAPTTITLDPILASL